MKTWKKLSPHITNKRLGQKS